MKLAVVGPTYPFRGGIAHYTTLLVEALRTRHSVRFYSFKRMYPRLLFKGRSDRDPSARPLLVSDVRYDLDAFLPHTWRRVGRDIAAWRPHATLMMWWVPFWSIPFGEVARQARSASAVVFLCHNVDPHESGVFDRALARLAWRQAHGFVVHSTEDERRMRLILPEARLWVTPHPTYAVFDQQPIDRDEARRRLGVEGHTLLFFGLVRPYKGLIDLIEALPAVLADVDVRLIVAGEIWGGDREYRRRVEALGLAERVRFEDRYIPNEEVSVYFRAADVVVLPYRTASGSGVLQIAYGLGVPVIATRVGGLQEAVRDGETGFLTPPADPGALATAIRKYYQEGRSETFSRNIRLRRDEFDWERIVQVLESATTELQHCRLR